MIWVDLAIIGIVVLSALLSLWRGTVAELLSLAVWLVAFGVGLALMAPVMAQLEPHVNVVSVQAILAFGAPLLATLVVGGLINIIILRILKRGRPRAGERLLGTVFGGLRGFCAVAALMLMASFTRLPEDGWWQQSLVLQQMTPMTGWLRGMVPVEIEPPATETEPVTETPTTVPS